MVRPSPLPFPVRSILSAGLVIVVLGLVSAPAAAAAEGSPSGRSTGQVGEAAADQGRLVAAVDFVAVAALDELTEDHAKLFRLYWALFGREPDPDGARYWIGQHDACVSLPRIASAFAAGPEYSRRYRALDDRETVSAYYRNILGRDPDPDGLDYWVDQLRQGRLDLVGVMLYMSMSTEFVDRHPYPSDGVPGRSCHLPDGRPTDRSVHVLAGPASTTTTTGRATTGGETTGRPTVASVVGLDLDLAAPAAVIERLGFHQSTHPGALALEAADDGVGAAVRSSVMASRGRGTVATGAADIAVEPTVTITAPVSGVVARAGSYVLYCRHRDGYVVINPDRRPDLEVKVLHVQGVAVRAGDRVEVGQPIAARATPFPFRSQIDALTAEPSWPHVHLEVVDPSIPRPPSSGRGC